LLFFFFSKKKKMFEIFDLPKRPSFLSLFSLLLVFCSFVEERQEERNTRRKTRRKTRKTKDKKNERRRKDKEERTHHIYSQKTDENYAANEVATSMTSKGPYGLPEPRGRYEEKFSTIKVRTLITLCVRR